MRPNYQNLLRCKGGKLTAVLPNTAIGKTGVAASRYASKVTRTGSNLHLEVGDGDPSGMWVSYAPTRATYGVATGGESWAASGPFSGCHMIVGKKDGNIFVAHIAQPGPQSDEDWAARGWQDEIWARWKVPVPSDKFFASSIVFVDWAGGARVNAISATRIDVKHNRMGALDDTPMDIFNVVQLF